MDIITTVKCPYCKAMNAASNIILDLPCMDKFPKKYENSYVATVCTDCEKPFAILYKQKIEIATAQLKLNVK
jgi:hypothetical protein